jgi:tRNA G18 (ribose-2'-O)-methylase SpoU
MVTDRYQHIRHHEDFAEFSAWAHAESLTVIGVDNVPGSELITTADLPRACVFLFGQEGPGLSPAAVDAAHAVLHIPQFGSTRSVNAGVAAGIAMYEWIHRHAPEAGATPLSLRQPEGPATAPNE